MLSWNLADPAVVRVNLQHKYLEKQAALRQDISVSGGHEKVMDTPRFGPSVILTFIEASCVSTLFNNALQSNFSEYNG